MRLQKIIAQAGITSRRKAEEMIQAGLVSVNGKVATLGTVANPTDNITISGKPISTPQPKRYIMLHKPTGVVTTSSDQFNRPTVLDFVPSDIRVFSVGRLDYDTSGLLLLTNDGEWANTLTHPSYEIQKTYIATIKGIPTDQSLQTFRTGINIENKLTAPAKIKILSHQNSISTAKITIHEGRNRQVRKMCEAINHPVLTLQRIAIGKLKLEKLPLGEWRDLTESEVKTLGTLSPTPLQFFVKN